MAEFQGLLLAYEQNAEAELESSDSMLVSRVKATSDAIMDRAG